MRSQWEKQAELVSHDHFAITEPIVTFIDVHIVVLHQYGGRQHDVNCRRHHGFHVQAGARRFATGSCGIT